MSHPELCPWRLGRTASYSTGIGSWADCSRCTRLKARSRRPSPVWPSVTAITGSTSTSGTGTPRRRSPCWSSYRGWNSVPRPERRRSSPCRSADANGQQAPRHLHQRQFIHAIQRRDFVRFRQRREIEDVVDEEIDRALEGHDGLADVDEFGGAGADGVDTEDAAIFLMNEEFQHADLVAQQLPSRSEEHTSELQ